MDEVKFIWVYLIYYEYYVLFFLMSRWYMYNVYVIYVYKKKFLGKVYCSNSVCWGIFSELGDFVWLLIILLLYRKFCLFKNLFIWCVENIMLFYLYY